MGDCPQCEYWRSKGAKFCAGCGKALGKKEEDEKGSAEFIIGILVTSMMAAVIIVNTAVCITRFGDICRDCAGLGLGIRIPYGLGSFGILTIPDNCIGVLLALLIICEMSCLVYAMARLFKCYKAYQETGNKKLISDSGICTSGRFLSVSFLLSVAFVLFAYATGLQFDSSWLNGYTENQQILLLTRAGTREELMYRVFWIGLPMMILALAVNRDRRSWQYLFGGFGMSKAALFFILLSSVLFGLGHLSGWGWGKVLDAAVSGILLAYIYVEYGLYVSIIMHTVNDTIQCFMWAGLGASLSGLALVSLVGFGIILIILWAIRMTNKTDRIPELQTFPKKLDCGLLKMWGRH